MPGCVALLCSVRLGLDKFPLYKKEGPPAGGKDGPGGKLDNFEEVLSNERANAYTWRSFNYLDCWQRAPDGLGRSDYVAWRRRRYVLARDALEDSTVSLSLCDDTLNIDGCSACRSSSR